jgi:predicted dinucleotide-binding enzyme
MLFFIKLSNQRVNLYFYLNTNDVVKCFNNTGFENVFNPIYSGNGIDMFIAGNSEKGIEIATQLAKEIGFEKYIILEEMTDLT